MTGKPISRKTNIAVQELESEILIYDFKINKAFCLNQTSALVYNLADGTKTVAEISDSISAQLRTNASEDFVWLALDKLKRNDLLESGTGLTDRFAGLSRREIIKKVGLASMIMLPVISSLVAPNAATAASCTGNGAACTPSNNTQSNCCNSNQRCFNSACTNCSTTNTPIASCQSAECCSQRSDRNLCCSGTFSETQVGVDFVCRCAA